MMKDAKSLMPAAFPSAVTESGRRLRGDRLTPAAPPARRSIAKSAAAVLDRDNQRDLWRLRESQRAKEKQHGRNAPP